jgi:serine/threonine protein kinase
MTDTIDSTWYGKPLTIGPKCGGGGQGDIFATNDPGILLKQFEPTRIADDPGQQQDLRHKAETAYKAFCTVTTGHPAELASLPREYLTFRGNPAYLMQKADGVELQTFFQQKKITQENRLPLASALARALSALHSAQLVHADPNPENYIVKQDATGFTVIVLDMDGGGLLSPPGPVYPMSQPKRIYKAPELCALQWEQLRERFLFFAPDCWALAVLLYQILVDYEGPFCTVKTHPNRTVKNYTPFKTYAYRDQATEWPLPWQEALMRHAKLSDEVVSLFYETFQHRFILNGKQKQRPTAAGWEKALLSTTACPSVSHVYMVPTPSMIKTQQTGKNGHQANGEMLSIPVKSALPPSPVPVTGKDTTSQTSLTLEISPLLPEGLTASVSSGQGRAPKGLPLRARVKQALFTALLAPRGACGWYKVFGGTFMVLNLITF